MLLKFIFIALSLIIHNSDLTSSIPHPRPHPQVVTRRDRRIHFKKSKEFFGIVASRDCDFYYNDYTYWKAKNIEECVDFCRNYYDGICTHFVYRLIDKKCLIKQGRVYLKDSHPTFDTPTICGIRCNKVRTDECRYFLNNPENIPKFYDGPPNRMLHSMDCMFDKTPMYGFYNATKEQCLHECRRIPSCTHFNFHHNMCSMFTGPTELREIHPCHNPNCGCGVDCQSMNNDVCNIIDSPDFVVTASHPSEKGGGGVIAISQSFK